MSSHPSFIVVFKDGVTDEQIKQRIDDVKSNGGAVTHQYSTVLKGFTANIPESYFGNLQRDDIIKYIEPNSVVTTQ